MIYALLLVAVVVAVDLLLFRDHPRRRLAANVGIALVFAVFYLPVPEPHESTPRRISVTRNFAPCWGAGL